MGINRSSLKRYLDQYPELLAVDHTVNVEEVRRHRADNPRVIESAEAESAQQTAKLPRAGRLQGRADAKARLDEARAQQAELDLAVRQGELVDPREMVDAIAEAGNFLRDKFTAGVQNPRRPWKDAASSEDAEKRYAAGVTRAAQQKTRQKVLATKSESDWKDAAINVGAPALAASAAKATTNYGKQLPTILEAGTAAQNAANQISGESMASRLQRGPAAATAVHRIWARKKGITPEV